MTLRRFALSLAATLLETAAVGAYGLARRLELHLRHAPVRRPTRIVRARGGTTLMLADGRAIDMGHAVDAGRVVRGGEA